MSDLAKQPEARWYRAIPITFLVLITVVALLSMQFGWPLPPQLWILYVLGYLINIRMLALSPFLRYRVTQDGIELHSLLRHRMIPYEAIVDILVVRANVWIGALTATSAVGYHVGIYRLRDLGVVDVAASRCDARAVVLMLRTGRPVIFTPIDPDAVAELMRTHADRHLPPEI